MEQILSCAKTDHTHAASHASHASHAHTLTRFTQFIHARSAPPRFRLACCAPAASLHGRTPENPGGIVMSQNATVVSPLMQQVSTYIATALHVKVPDAVCERAKLHIVDTFAAMISGSRLL